MSPEEEDAGDRKEKDATDVVVAPTPTAGEGRGDGIEDGGTCEGVEDGVDVDSKSPLARSRERAK